MASFRLSPAALGDLESINEYIAKDDPTAAARLVEAILDRCWLLTRQPLIGTSRDDLQTGLRDMRIGKYVIFRRVLDEENAVIEVVRILHHARDHRRIL